jgi:hypothetical protein
MCAAVSDDGGIYTTAAPATGPWTLRSRQNVNVDALDCPAPHLCVAADHNGTLVPNGAPQSPAWSPIALRQPDQRAQLTDLACTSPTVCVAVDDHGRITLGS